MRSTFWPNRIWERQSSQNRPTGLKSFSKREKSALSMKIVQSARFRSCAGGFAHIVFLRVKLLKIVTLVSNSLQYGKTVRFSWKLYKTLFWGHAEHVLAKSHFWASKFLKSSNWPEIVLKTGNQCAFHENCTKRSFQVMRNTFWLNRIFERQSSHWPEIHFKTGKQCACHENCTKPSFQVMRSTFWPNRICERQSCQNRHTGLKFFPKKGKQCAFHENCTKPFFQVMGSTFWPNCIFNCQSSQNQETRLKVSSKRKNSALSMKIG